MSVISDIINNYMFEAMELDTFAKIEQDIRQHCPGNYQVELLEVPTGIEFKLLFDDPEEATVFRLKQWI